MNLSFTSGTNGGNNVINPTPTSSHETTATTTLSTQETQPKQQLQRKRSLDNQQLRPFGPGQGSGKRWGRLKSDAAQRRENELKERFALAMCHAEQHKKQLTSSESTTLSYQIGKPYDHLTCACYASFRRYVREQCEAERSNSGLNGSTQQLWSVSRREASPAEKVAHGEKRKGPVYFTYLTYSGTVQGSDTSHQISKVQSSSSDTICT